MRPMPRRERARGVLLGLALGDALGAPFEGRSRVDREQVEAWRDAREPLRWTDDTHMALTLAHHLLDDPELADPDALGAAFARAHADEPWRGYGSGPPQVFALVEQGLSFEQAARTLFGGSGSFGNGAAMRVAQAMAGAMAGAAWGLEHLPTALLDGLEARAELEQLADALSSA
jgi:poly(ADP-ribose) glycohydrolase ARH3